MTQIYESVCVREQRIMLLLIYKTVNIVLVGLIREECLTFRRLVPLSEKTKT